MYITNQTSYYRRIGVANIQCIGNENALLQCSHDALFHIDASCDHKRDVFLRCLCGDCNDYIPHPRDNVRLANRTSISGRLEVFSPERGWKGMCSTGWTASNTRVACRQLGFLDQAGSYPRNRDQSVNFVSFYVNCSGNESSLFDCKYSTTSTVHCSNPIYIVCECSDCSEFILQVPQQKNAMTQSTEVFEWRLKNNVSNFEILFLSQKNPQTLMYVDEGKVVKGNTRFKHRIHLINDDYTTVGFNITNITRTDMGIFALHVRSLLFDSTAILVVTDFAAVPDRVIRRQVYDSVVLSWDLTALRQLRDINHDIMLTTPTSGRLDLYYYYTHWLTDNPRPYSVPRLRDLLHPTIIIDNVSAKDAGNYVIELKLASPVHQWLNASWQFTTLLVVDNTRQPDGQSVIVIVLAVLVAVLSAIVCVLLVQKIWHRCTDHHQSSSFGESRSKSGPRHEIGTVRDDQQTEIETVRDHQQTVTSNYDQPDNENSIEMSSSNNNYSPELVTTTTDPDTSGNVTTHGQTRVQLHNCPPAAEYTNSPVLVTTINDPGTSGNVTTHGQTRVQLHNRPPAAEYATIRRR